MQAITSTMKYPSLLTCQSELIRTSISGDVSVSSDVSISGDVSVRADTHVNQW